MAQLMRFVREIYIPVSCTTVVDKERSRLFCELKFLDHSKHLNEQFFANI